MYLSEITLNKFKGHVLKKGIVFSAIVLGLSCLNLAHADSNEIKLKKACLKDYPQAVGQTDQELLSIYQQVCDKANAERRNDLLAQVAMRYHQLGQNLNALFLANNLKQQNVRGKLLTDVMFLSSVSVAQASLNDMRNSEMRYLSDDLTYPPAKELSDSIKASQPAPDTTELKGITDESLKRAYKNNVVNNNVKRQQPAPVAKPKPQVQKTHTAPAPVAAPAPVSKPATPASKPAASPFESFK